MPTLFTSIQEVVNRAKYYYTFAPKEQEQLAELSQKLGADKDPASAAQAETAQPKPASTRNRDEFEGGYGGQEDLEDRYATTYGAH